MISKAERLLVEFCKGCNGRSTVDASFIKFRMKDRYGWGDVDFAEAFADEKGVERLLLGVIGDWLTGEDAALVYHGNDTQDPENTEYTRTELDMLSKELCKLVDCADTKGNGWAYISDLRDFMARERGWGREKFDAVLTHGQGNFFELTWHEISGDTEEDELKQVNQGFWDIYRTLKTVLMPVDGRALFA